MKKNILSKSNLLYIVTVLISIFILAIAGRYVSGTAEIFKDETDMEIARTTVKSIIDRSVEDYSYDGVTSQSIQVTFESEVISGDRKGEILTAVQNLDYTPPYIYTNEVSIDDKVILIDAGLDVSEWHFVEYIRTDKLMILGGIFVLALLAFGRKKGLSTLLSLSLTFGAVFTVLIPAILGGKNIYLWAIMTCLYSILATLLILNGFNKKSFSTIIGCFSGVLIAGAITLIMDKALALTGVTGDESLYLAYLPTDVPINLRAIIFAAIIIGAMGAIMDVAMSISSSLWELREHNPNTTARTLFSSGMTIGRDIMGTMANTLVLAYIGSSLSTVLLLVVYDSSIIFLLNREMIVIEILQALVGSMGILLSIPMTSLFASFIYTKALKKLH
ncbi:YibE/F family protein [Alkalibacter mobilis]|uniref:YibE/F family protein n=1 Tax=Alkalibacter mobilis TaxID=2787712 RepID=UPI00189DD2A3|nr:YibE/F family protein [Alkalibacter mobilis]MBF7095569.1 YibE/F family protein [Alkalibacter mobilis]